MNGSAGLSPSRNRKTRRQHIERVRTELKKECAGLVAGEGVLTEPQLLKHLYNTDNPRPWLVAVAGSRLSFK
jgi:hypothetical protein